ncbi:hypothetical protein ABZ297_24010 [Nonomuraea sp. NPDC005983]|uniref:hypothetical protein n=1 Tax=Nonomuraea sp. NPDC005983 TaxID=3155595 RepID=UPI0033BB0EF7
MPETDSTGGHHPADDAAQDDADGKDPASPTLTPDEAATEPPDDTPEGFEPV